MIKRLLLQLVLFFLTVAAQAASGDLVYSYNTITGETEQKEVTSVSVRTSNHLNYLTIVDANGNEQVIETTDSHPIWVVSGNDLENRAECTNLTDSDSTLTPQGRWVNARDVQVGDTVLGRTWNTVSVSKVESRTEMVQVYNFIVDDFHSYAVGICEILVHNQSMEGFKNAADAIGDIHGYAKTIEIVKAKNPEYIKRGYTEIHYILDSNGVQHTVPFNPRTKIYDVSHRSSGWY